MFNVSNSTVATGISIPNPITVCEIGKDLIGGIKMLRITDQALSVAEIQTQLNSEGMNTYFDGTGKY